MAKTLNYTRPDEYANARKVCPPLAQMMERFTTFRSLDSALGLSGSASAHWARGKNAVSQPNLRAMNMWLELNPEEAVKPLQNGHINGAAKVPEPAPEPETVFMVVAPEAKAGKVRKVREMLGCEVEAI